MVTAVAPSLLEANPRGGDGTGIVTWLGSGVVDNGDGTWAFDPAIAGQGQQVLTAQYVQDGVCSVRDTLSVFVRSQSESSVRLSLTEACVGQAIDVTFVADPASIVTPTFTGGNFTGNDDGSGGTLIYATPGDYIVTIEATRGSCVARDSQTITILDGATPGIPVADQPVVCLGAETDVALFDLLDGEDPGGTWESVDGLVTAPSFDPVAGMVATAALAAGEYLFTYTVVGSGVCAGTESTVSVTVLDEPDASFQLSSSTVCAGSPITLTLATDPRFATVTAPGGTVTAQPDGRSTITFPSVGEYTITADIDISGCTTSSSQLVTVQDELDAGTALMPLVLCASDPTVVELTQRLENSDDGGTWSVSEGDVGPGALDSVTGQLDLTGLGSGNYAFDYTLDGGGCAITSATVAVNLQPGPPADAGADQLLDCQVGTVTIGGTQNGANGDVTYLWRSSTGAPIMDSTSATIEVMQPGTYTLTVTNATGCSSFDDVSVTSLQDPPVLQIDVSNITCFDAEDGTLIITEVQGGTAPFTYSLNGEDQGSERLFTGLQAQEYDLEVRDAAGCFSNVFFDLSEPEELTVELRFPNDTTEVNFGDEVIIGATVNGGNTIDTLLWEPDSLINNEGVNNIRFVAMGSRMISVTVVDSLGCTATDREMLIVRKDRPVYVPTAFSPNGDNNNDLFYIGANTEFVIGLQDLRIYDRWGELMFSTEEIEGGTFPANDPRFGWNGKHGDTDVNPQVFVYSVKAFFADGTSEEFKGDFVLVR